MSGIKQGAVRALRSKKVLLVSEFGGSNQPYTYATSFAGSISRLGCEVKCFDCKRSFVPLWGGSSNLMPSLIRSLNDLLVNRALKKVFSEFAPDIVLMIKAENISFRTLRWMKSNAEFKLMNFYPDSPFCLWNGNSNSHVLRSLPFYDRFAIWSHTLIPALESAGCKEVCYFPFAYDDEIFFSGVQLSRREKVLYSTDVLFVGTWDAEREANLLELGDRITENHW